MSQNQLAERIPFRKASLWFGFALYLAINAAAILTLQWLAKKNGQNGIQVIFLVAAAFVVGKYIQILVTELGHVVSGLRAGMQFRQLHFGMFALSRFEGKYEVFRGGLSPLSGHSFMVCRMMGITRPF